MDQKAVSRRVTRMVVCNWLGSILLIYTLWKLTHSCYIYINSYAPTYAYAFRLAFKAVTIWQAFKFAMIVKSIGATHTTKRADGPLLWDCLTRALPHFASDRPKICRLKGPQGMEAFAFGSRKLSLSAIVISEEIEDELRPIELSAVIAHETGHLLHNDTILALVFESVKYYVLGVGALISLLALVCNIASLPQLQNNDLIGFFMGVLLLIIGCVIGHILPMLISHQCEYAADLRAACITGSGQHLADALETMADYSDMDLSEPDGKIESIVRWFQYSLRTHPPVQKRIARLLALEE